MLHLLGIAEDDTARTVSASSLRLFLRRYARHEGHALAPHVVGRQPLDRGAGEGWVAEAEDLPARWRVWTC
jgi:hypothetical protein